MYVSKGFDEQWIWKLVFASAFDIDKTSRVGDEGNGQIAEYLIQLPPTVLPFYQSSLDEKETHNVAWNLLFLTILLQIIRVSGICCSAFHLSILFQVAESKPNQSKSKSKLKIYAPVWWLRQKPSKLFIKATQISINVFTIFSIDIISFLCSQSFFLLNLSKFNKWIAT